MSANALLTLSRELHEADSLEAVMVVVLECIRATTRYDRVWVMVPEGDILQTIGYVQPDMKLVNLQMAQISVKDDRWLQRCVTSTKMFVANDVRLEPDADQEKVELFGVRTQIIVPMIRLDERIGAFVVGTFADCGVMPPTDREVETIVQVATFVSVVAGRICAETARAKAEAQLRVGQRMEALGQLAGEIAHDFNNVLASVVGNSELAARLLVGHEAAPLITDIQTAATRATALTRQLLAFSKGQVLARKHLYLSDVVLGLSRMLERLLPSNLSLSVDIRDTSIVYADQGQLEQVIMNLVINARDAMPNGGEICVVVDQVSAADLSREKSARVTVSDTGSGMTDAVAARIFEPFFTTKPGTTGTGLGLAVVDSIVRQHGGSVALSTKVNEGTRFDVVLPVSNGPVGAVPDAVNQASVQGAGELLLVADDDHSIRTYLKRVLIEAGYTVCLAENGIDAVKQIEQQSPVLVLTDLVMPRGGGKAVLWSAEKHDIPVIVMTGYTAGEQLEHPHWLMKPFDSDALLAMICGILK
ncbi:MAG: response regulator [Kofleriaceae bacterium]|nr:response regulator [Kofleriaceae bacterium]